MAGAWPWCGYSWPRSGWAEALQAVLGHFRAVQCGLLIRWALSRPVCVLCEDSSLSVALP